MNKKLFLKNSFPLDQTLAFIVNRLGRLVLHQFGYTLHYTHFDHHSQEHQKIRYRLQQQTPVQIEKELYFPVYLDHHMMGIINLVGLTHNHDEQKKELHHLIESYMKSATLILLRLLEKHQILDVQSLTPSPPNLNFPILMEGRSASDLKKLALEIHDLSDRHTFVHLDSLCWMTCQDLILSGPITIYIPDITSLSFYQQNQISELLSLEPQSDFPQIIGGSLVEYSILSSRSDIHALFLLRLSQCYLKLTRPFAEYQGLLGLLFQEKKQNQDRH